jgi:hypothetical protein
MRVMLADVRGGVESLGKWRGTAGGSGVEARLATSGARRGAVGRAIDGVTEPSLLRRFSTALADVDAAFEELSPPVEWAAVEETLEAHRAAALGDEG